jgi:alpha-D-xyloside xylohydrolase
MDEDEVQLRLTGCDDPVEREGHLAVRCAGDVAIEVDFRVDPGVSVAETSFSFDLETGEQFYGFGERFDQWGHAGRTVVGWTEDSPFGDDEDHHWTYWPLPYFVTGGGSGLAVGTTARTWFHLGSERPDAWSVSAEDSNTQMSLFLCRSPRDVVERFTACYGRPPVPAPWGLGVWKTMLGGEASVEAEVQRMEEIGLPFNAIWIYDQLEPATNSGWGSAMGYPEGAYADIPGLISRLHNRGHRVLGYLNPQFLSGGPAFSEGAANGYFLHDRTGAPYLLPCSEPAGSNGVRTGTGALLDPTNPDAVQWWSEMLRRLLVDSGYDGWMHDFGELTPVDALSSDGRTGAQLRNEYPVAYQRPCAEVVKEHKPDAVFFVRSGYLGSTALCPAAWAGDQHTQWEGGRGLRGALRAGLSLSLAGVNAFGPDIGGFFGTDEPEHNEDSRELWIRWCQFGALCPVMRDHLGFKRRPGAHVVDLWYDDETIATWRRYAQFHLSLLPYLYSLAHEAQRTGVTSLRPLLLEFPEDQEARAVDDQYMLGPALLVAPVLEEGARARRIYFPAGRWYSFYDDSEVDGPGWHEVEAPLSRIPIFARQGSAVVMSLAPWQPGQPSEAASLLADAELRIYPSPEGEEMVPVRLSDGAVVSVRRAGDALTLAIQGLSASRLTVRVPAGSGFAGASGFPGAPGRLPLALAANGYWWDAPGRRAVVPWPPGSTSEITFD